MKYCLSLRQFSFPTINKMYISGFKELIFQLLALLIYITLVFAEWNTKDYMKREHSLYKPYQGKIGL